MNSMEQGRLPGLRLAPHVQACRNDDQVILLDLRRDRYLAIRGAQVQALAAAVEGWPRSPADDDPSPSLSDVSVLTRRLVMQGLLTYNERRSERLPAASIPEATASLGNGEAMQGAAIGPRLVLRFLQSVIAAAASLRWCSLLAVARAVAARRAQLARDKSPLRLDAAKDVVAAYERLRPLVFTTRDACLFDSLALIHFLAHQGMFPRWVIGVKTHPFAAHSWVQSEGTVLNDLHEHVRRFTPILVV